MLAVLIDEPPFFEIAIQIVVLLAAISIAIGLLCISLSFVVAAWLAAKYALSEDFALVRISTLDSEDIVEGCVRAARERLRLLWSVAFWMLPSAWIMVIALINFHMWIDNIPEGFSSYAAYIVWLLGDDALIVTVMLMLILYLAWRAAINLGVWAGMRWPRAARVVAMIVAAGGLAAAVFAFVWMLTVRQHSARDFEITILSMRIVAYGVPFLLIVIGQLVYNDAIIYLEDHVLQPSKQ